MEVNRNAINQMYKRKDEKWAIIQDKTTGKIRRAKLSYAKQLEREGKRRILDVEK